ncbi:MAG: DUF1415 domain-containing protein [Methylobacter sp.]
MTDQQVTTTTKNWLQAVVVGYSICPFAKRELERESIRFSVNRDKDAEQFLLRLIQECDRLDTDPNIETTLLIYPDAFADFDNYLDFLEIAEELLVEQGYEGIYQLASFHPDYIFQGCEPDDPANYTNRSPYPMLHLLRESSIEQAVAAYPNPENIPERNVELTRKLGLAKMQALLAASYLNNR